MKKIILLITLLVSIFQTSVFAQIGALDTTFMTGTGFGIIGNNLIQVTKAVVLSNKKIVAAGRFDFYNGMPSTNIVRLNSNGTLDTTFNTGTGFNGTVQDLAVMNENKIIIVGDFTSYNGYTANRIIRLNSDGNVDTTFNAGTGADSTIYKVLISHSAFPKITLFGEFMQFNGQLAVQTCRLLHGGEIDTNYTSPMTVNLLNPSNDTTWISLYHLSPLMQSNGKIIVSCAISNYTNSPSSGKIIRLNTNGSRDSSFNEVIFDDTTNTRIIRGIYFQGDSSILVSTDNYNSLLLNGSCGFSLSRYFINGILDTSFHEVVGKPYTSIPFNQNYCGQPISVIGEINSLVVMPDHKIIIGTGSVSSINRKLYRLDSNGEVDSSFGTNHHFNVSPQYSMLQDENHLIALGGFSLYDSVVMNRIARIHVDTALIQTNHDPCSAITVIPKAIGDTLYITKDTVQISNFPFGSNPKVWYKFTATSKSHVILIGKLNNAGNSFSVQLELYHANSCNEIDTLQPILDGNAAQFSIKVPFEFGEDLIIGDDYYYSLQNTYSPNFPPSFPAFESIEFYGIYSMPNDNMEGAIELQPCVPFYSNNYFANPSIASGCSGDDLWYKFTATSNIVNFILESADALSSHSFQLYEKQVSSNNTITYVPVGNCYSAGMGNKTLANYNNLTIGSEYFLSAGNNYSYAFNSFYTRFSILFDAKKPNINIALLSSLPLCEKPNGIFPTFQATAVNGGANPFYKWYINGSVSPLGGFTTISVYTFTSPLQQGDSIYCVMFSADPCYSIPDTSNIFIVPSNTVLATKWFLDIDNDGYGSSSNKFDCSQPVGYVADSGDCAPNNALIHESFPFYADNDGDGYGNDTLVYLCTESATASPLGYSLNFDDCNDNDPFIYPNTIEKMEYFIDTDPGVGMGINLPIISANIDTLLVSASIVLPTLSEGHHLVVIRVKTCGGNWGFYEQKSIYINSTTPITPVGPLVSAEYFIDTDPGIGNATAISIPTGDTISLQNISLNLPTNLTAGHHQIGVRTKDSIGNWGFYEQKSIYVTAPSTNAVGPVVAAEFFIDTDPGIGNATAISIPTGDTISLQNISLNLPTNLSAGHHNIGVRTKDSIGNWGFFESRIIYVDEPLVTFSPIVAAEYFIDTDPGVGNGTPFVITPADTVIQNVQVSYAASLALGSHKMGVRVKNSEGKWGHFENKVFAVKPPPSMLPGSGNAITLDGVNDYIQLPSILNGASQFTIDFWIKTTENGSNGTYWQKPTIIGNANPSSPDGDFGITTNNGQLGVWNGTCSCGDQALQTTKSINDNKWHHVAVVDNGTNMVLYVDGQLLAGNIPSNIGIQNVTYPWRIGMNNSCCSGGSPHSGTIDEMRFWNIPLTETQIRERMCRKISSSEALFSNLEAYYNFDEQVVAIASDGSNNINNATLLNGAIRTLSGAPIGNVSTYNYAGNSSAVTLAHPTRSDQLQASISAGTASALHVYCVTERPNTLLGVDTILNNDAYFGVFAVDGSSAQFNATYNYTGVANISNEDSLTLHKRNENNSLTWTNTNLQAGISSNTFLANDTYRQEYILGEIAPTYATINLTLFIEGYYLGNGVMASALSNQGQVNSITDADSITVELHQSTSPYAIVETVTGVLKTNGFIICNFPSSTIGNNYYITIKHRNGLQTWSANPILILGITNYDFSTSSVQAFGNNQVQVEPNVWAIYSGDLSADENIDLLDIGILENDITNFQFGYFATDINGDGNVDLLDSPTVEANVNGFVFSSHP